MFNWIEYHVYLPVFALAVELCEDEYVLDDLTSSPDERRLFFWLEVQRSFIVRSWRKCVGDMEKTRIYSHAFTEWNNALHRLSRLKSETREFDCRREMSHSFPFSNYLIIVTKSIYFIDPCHFSNGKRGNSNVTYFFSLFNLFFMMRYYLNSLSRRSLVLQWRAAPVLLPSSPFLLHVVYYSGDTSVEMRYVLYVQCWWENQVGQPSISYLKNCWIGNPVLRMSVWWLTIDVLCCRCPFSSENVFLPMLCYFFDRFVVFWINSTII